MLTIPESPGRFGLGIDIESVGRFRRETRLPNRFLSRTFTRGEVEYCMSKADPAVHFAGTFAAKEAAFKAVSAIYHGRMGVADFEVSRRRDGAPEVRYVGEKAELKGVDISLSVSHTAENAVAVAISILRG